MEGWRCDNKAADRISDKVDKEQRKNISLFLLPALLKYPSLKICLHYLSHELFLYKTNS